MALNQALLVVLSTCVHEPPMWAAWSKLPEATFAGGDVPFRAANGLPIYDYYKTNPLSGNPFNEFIRIFSRIEIAAVVDQFD